MIPAKLAITLTVYARIPSGADSIDHPTICPNGMNMNETNANKKASKTIAMRDAKSPFETAGPPRRLKSEVRAIKYGTCWIADCNAGHGKRSRATSRQSGNTRPSNWMLRWQK